MGGHEEAKTGEGRSARGNWKHMQWSDCRSSPFLPHPDNHTQQRREMGQKWCEAECEGDDTWAVFCSRLAVFYGRKMATRKMLNKYR